MKKKISLLLAALLCGSCLTGLAGCAKDESVETTSMVYAWPLGTGGPEDTVLHYFALKFAEEAGRLSDGRIKIKVYGNSVLGGDRELLESCESGDIPFIIQTTAPQIDFIPETAVFDLPCAFSDLDQLRKTIGDPGFMETISTAYDNSGYHLLGLADQGFRIMSTNKAVHKMDDFKGQKVRTMENVYHISYWKAIGSSPTPMTFSEVYIGLQQNTIDAQENAYEQIVSARLYEQQDYVVETNHIPNLLSLVASKSFYESLPKEDREILDEAARIAQEYAFELTDERIEMLKQVVIDSGTEVIEIDDDLHAQIVEAAQPVYSEIRQAVGDELVDALINARDH